MIHKIAWVMAIAGLAILLGCGIPVHAQQQETTTVSGHVVNGTASASIPQDVPILLQVLRPGAQPEPRTTQADNTGWFAFPEVSREESATYTLSAVYRGIGYIFDLLPQDDWTDIRLTVYEATSDLEDVSLATTALLALGVEPETRTIAFMEIIQVANKGDRVFIPTLTQGDPMNFLRFPLPASAFDLEVQAALPEGQVLQVDRGIALTTPVPPGEHGVALTYKVSYTGQSLDISRTFVKGTGTFRVLVPYSVGAVSSLAMVDLGETTFGTTRFHMLELRDVPPGFPVDLTLDGLPQPSLAGRIKRAITSLSWGMAAPVALSLALLALLVVGLRRTALPEPTAASAIGRDQESLAQSIADLDDQFEAGELEENVYQEQRQALKAQLLRLAWQEENSQ